MKIMRRFTGAMLLISGVTLLGFGNIADAAGPTQADFDVCNREAHAQAGSAGTASAGGDIVAKPGTPVSPSAAPATEPPTTPKLSSPSASPQSSSQVDAKTPSSAAAPQAAPSPLTADEARVANQADQLRGVEGAS